MTLAEYLSRFLRDNGITKVFAIQGGGSARLIDAIASTEGIDYFCNQHEQASAMSADGYARASGKIGCALSTSGPGATNLLTGCCGAYFDSIPILFITGQVSSFRLKGKSKVRCMHTQETDIVDVFRPVTKYSVALKDPYDIRYELEKCIYIATNGRPGPVLIDIPDDYQRQEIDIKKLRAFDATKDNKDSYPINEDRIHQFFELVSNSNKPLIIIGGGIHISHSEKEFIEFADKMMIPVVYTWAAKDILEEESIHRFGTIGMNGSIQGNYAVRNADLLIIIGARLDQHTIIVSLKDFAKDTKKVYVDIDKAEIEKFKEFGNELTMSFNTDIKLFLHTLNKMPIKSENNFAKWIQELNGAQKSNAISAKRVKDEMVNPYLFFESLSECVDKNALVFIDTGSSLVWTEQYFKVKSGQRIHSSLNNTPMGYGLPAAIGAAVASDEQVISINGDGGLQMNLQELATVIRHNLNIKIILFDNTGYGMLQRTQDTYMGSRYEATDIKSGLAFPDFRKLFEAYGFETIVIDNNKRISDIKSVFEKKGPGCVIVKVSINEGYDTFTSKDIIGDKVNE